MTLHQIKATLKQRADRNGYECDSQASDNRPVLVMFASEMASRQYGSETLYECWKWFYLGWCAAQVYKENNSAR